MAAVGGKPIDLILASASASVKGGGPVDAVIKLMEAGYRTVWPARRRVRWSARSWRPPPRTVTQRCQREEARAGAELSQVVGPGAIRVSAVGALLGNRARRGLHKGDYAHDLTDTAQRHGFILGRQRSWTFEHLTRPWHRRSGRLTHCSQTGSRIVFPEPTSTR